ncbi:MAG TPA: zinc ABC transporter substrate-binding protein [Ktedonobacterales bacterium]
MRLGKLSQRTMRAALAWLALLNIVALGMAGCQANGGTGPSGVIQVVAGENFWGSIAAQLGGSHVSVTSIVSDPNADPHEYESSTTDARAFASASYVVLNGAGYDTWAQKMLDANPVSGRKVFTVANVLGKHNGDNPHFWYNPAYVERVADQITADYKTLDPSNATYYGNQREAFEAALANYHERIAAIRSSFAGRKIGSTESIVVYLADALGLDPVSPPAFMQAVSEGNDPPVSAVAAFQQQLTQRQISVLVYNKQTATSVTTNLQTIAAQQRIPMVGVTETIQPPTLSFQDWQTGQLAALQQALEQTK